MRSVLEIPDQTRDLREHKESPKERRGKRGAYGHLHLWAVSLLLLSLICLIIVGPLQGLFAPFPALLFLASFALFMVPGAMISALIHDEGLLGAARIPATFVFSVGVFGLPGIPLLVLHRSTNEYLLLCGAILAASMFVLAVVAFKGPAQDGANPPPKSWGTLLSVYWPWVPFLVLAGALAYASATKVHAPEEDVWAYLANVRDFLNAESLAYYHPFFGNEYRGFSRMMINGWLLEQAALAQISGIDPVEMTFRYLSPALVVLSLLATYALAKTVIGSETGGIITGCLLAILVLLSLTTPMAQSLLTPGGEFINRVTEDKYVARFIFVPVALALAVLALKTRKLRYLLLFAFICPSVVAVHPLGLVFIGLPVAGLGLLHLPFNLRDRGAWGYVGGLALSLLAVGGPPTLYLAATGSSLLQRIDSMAPRVAESLTEGLGYYDEIQVVGEQYIVDPVFLLNPAVLTAYVLGVPFLVLRVRQSPAAQLLLGTLLLVPIVCFVPPIANFAGEVIGPWILPRLAWPIPLAAVVVLGWLLWEGLTYARRRLVESGSRTERLAGVLLAPLLIFCGLVAAAPHSIAQVETVDQSGEIPEEQVSCSDPVFAWMDDGLPAASTVLAPDAENSCIMARASTASILNYRKQKIGANEYQVILERFYNGATLNTDTIRMLRYYEVDYIMLSREEELGEQMRHRPDSFTEVNIPEGQYVLYKVDLPNLETDALVRANDLLLSGDFDFATDAYGAVLEEARQTNDEHTLFLSYLGLGQSKTGQKLPDEAAFYFEQAAALSPEDEAAQFLLSRAKEAAGDVEEARAAQERAVELAPGNANLRLRLADLALKAGDEEEAIGQYRMLVEAFPEVPRYRALLGKALLLAGDGEAAEEQLQEATDLSPLSEEVYVEVGAALRDAGRLEAAAARYERAVELEPKNQLYNLDLGRIYSTLSTVAGWNEGYFEKAERTLIRAVGQQPVPGSSADSQQAALLTLGDLYYRWDREEEAISAYEQVLREDPESEAARNRLEELQG